jgi:hypothetical protein
MTGQQLWQIFSTTSVPTDQLKTLAYDLFHGKPTPEGNGAQAVDVFAKALSMPPAFAYKAFNCVQGGMLEKKGLLEQLAWVYQHKKNWTAAHPIDAVNARTAAYMETVAHRITVIRDAMAKQSPPPPAGGKPVIHAAKVAVAPAIVAKHVVPGKHALVALPVTPEKKDWRPTLVFFVGGTIASFILSIRNARHRFSAA